MPDLDKTPEQIAADDHAEEVESLEARLAHATTCAKWAAKLLRCFASSRPVPEWERCAGECEAL